MAEKLYVVQFTHAELQDVLSHVEYNQREGMYWGNAGQFYTRQERIINKCKNALLAAAEK